MSRTIAVALAAALTLPAMSAWAASAASAASDASFATSFEQGDPAGPSDTPDGETVNFTGSVFGDTSLLGDVVAVTGSGSSPDNEMPASAADAVPATKWLVRSGTGEIAYTLSQPASITGYVLTSANDEPGRDPRDFTVQGSLDGATWEVIDTRTEQSWSDGSSAGRLTPRAFELAARSQPYSHYRLVITANNGAADLLQLADWEPVDSARQSAAAPMRTRVDNGPTSSEVAKTGVGFTGTKALHFAGKTLGDGDARARNVLIDDVDVTVDAGTRLSYRIFPVLDPTQTYSATHVAVDLLFADGRRLSATARDSHGFGIAPRAQGEARVLWPDQWNAVTVDLSAFAGERVSAILLGYDQAAAPAGTPVAGWIDDVEIAPAPERDTGDGLVAFVDTRRGTNSTDGYSRGNTIPATAWPNGFNFFTPMTNADTDRIVYHYQRANNADNLPTLQGIGISHQPSLWIADRNQLAILPADTAEPTSSLSDRALAFRHENETARPDLYSVGFENGLKAEVAPTDHGGVYRFAFTGDVGSVVLDRVVGDAQLSVAPDGAVTGWVEGGSSQPGRTRMFVAGRFDATPTAVGATPRGDRSGVARFAAFDTRNEKTVELRLATSLISLDQARRNLELEVSDGGFDTVRERAAAAWNERLGVISDVAGASDDQLVSLYSSLYRLNLYPNSQFENTGTAEAPVYRYASPVSPTSGAATDTVTNARVVDGKMYVNHGFWDTYRTAWPAYALLYPDVAAEITDGFVQQFRDGGWVSRWSAPGYADSMTGTSSDVSFAEMVSAGVVPTDVALDAYESAVRNATALPPSANVGRKGIERSIFRGFTSDDVHESASWALEGYINDFGVAQMARALSTNPDVPEGRRARLTEEAAYFEQRSQEYPEMFHPEARTFTARHADGTRPAAGDVDKMAWGGAFTEASAWTFGFHVPFDVDGLAALYGGRRALVDELHAFLSTPERADRAQMHEAREARDIRVGMLGISNQISHHIPALLAEAGDPAGSQALVRDLMQRVFVGSEIGQGYVGDEDNGEFSAWYIFSALGLYPLAVGSANYTIGSPQFESVTVAPLGGPRLTIDADGTSTGSIYVDGVALNGRPISETTIDGSLLRAGGRLDFTMSSQPSTWGAKDLDEPLTPPSRPVSVTDAGYGALSASDGTNVAALTDEDMRTNATFAANTSEVTWVSASGPVRLTGYTLTAAASGVPQGWTLSGSMDGRSWTPLDARAGETFPYGIQTRPFTVASDQGAYSQYRLALTGQGSAPVALAELELFAAPAATSELAVSAGPEATVRVGEALAGVLGTVTGTGGSAPAVQVDFADGTAPADAQATANPLGGWAVTAPHTFARAGVYDLTVTARSGEAVATATTRVNVVRDDTMTGAFGNVCIGDAGTQAADCDGEAYGFDRALLAAGGFVQGQSLRLGDTGLHAEIPQAAPGRPDNVTGEGQRFAVDLGDGATRIALIGTATQGAKRLSATLHYADGSTQALPLEFGDWVDAANSPIPGTTRVGVSHGRLKGLTVESGERATAIYATTPVTLAVDDAGAPKRAVALTLPAEPGSLAHGGRTHLFAVASDGGARTPAATLTPRAVPTQRTGTAALLQLAEVTGGRGPLTATVAWGDGTGTVPATVDDRGVSAEHVFARSGVYTAWVTVDDGVASSAVAVEIRVEDPVVEPAQTSVAVTADATDVTVGAPVRLSARVAPAAATGSIEFLREDEIVGTVPVRDSAAHIDIVTDEPGRFAYRARFVAEHPDAFAGSVSDAVAVLVRPDESGPQPGGPGAPGSGGTPGSDGAETGATGSAAGGTSRPGDPLARSGGDPALLAALLLFGAVAVLVPAGLGLQRRSRRR